MGAPSMLDDLIARVDTAAGSADPLARLDAAIAVAAESTAAGERLLDQVVALARQAGGSWTDIGTRLGVSKQAARQRFAERTQPLIFGGAAQPARRLRVSLDAAATEAQRVTAQGIRAASRCSFCGRPERVAGRLIAGPGVHICATCVALAGEILGRPAT